MQPIDRDLTDREAKRLTEETMALEEGIQDAIGMMLVGNDARAAMAAFLILAEKIGRRSRVPPELYEWMTTQSAANYRSLFEAQQRKIDAQRRKHN